MLISELIAARIRDDAFMTGVQVRVERDEPDDLEQIIVTETQGYQGPASQAPLWSTQYTVHTMAFDRTRALSLCLRAYTLLRYYIPVSDDLYAHGIPAIEMTPGYMADDDRERPVYGFTFTYTISPKNL